MIAQPPQSLSWRCGYCERVVQANYAHKCSEYEAAWRRARVNGDAGDALDYGLDHIKNPKAQLGFLDDWRDGRELETRWPGFVRWLRVQREGVTAQGMAARSGETAQPVRPEGAIND